MDRWKRSKWQKVEISRKKKLLDISEKYSMTGSLIKAKFKRAVDKTNAAINRLDY